MKKVPLATEESGSLVGGVASHLNHPFGGGMSGQASETDPARFQMDEEEDVVGGETSPGEHCDGEEVGTCQDGHVGVNEILPGGIVNPLGRRGDPVSAKDVCDGLIGDRMAEIGKRSDNPVVSPTGVFSGDGDNERLDVARDSGPPR